MEVLKQYKKTIATVVLAGGMWVGMYFFDVTVEDVTKYLTFGTAIVENVK